jgi:hypothetical protein
MKEFAVDKGPYVEIRAAEALIKSVALILLLDEPYTLSLTWGSPHPR